MTQPCQHYWVLHDVDGRTLGTCRECGTQREFPKTLESGWTRDGRNLPLRLKIPR